MRGAKYGNKTKIYIELISIPWITGLNNCKCGKGNYEVIARTISVLYFKGFKNLCIKLYTLNCGRLLILDRKFFQ